MGEFLNPHFGGRRASRGFLMVGHAGGEDHAGGQLDTDWQFRSELRASPSVNLLDKARPASHQTRLSRRVTKRAFDIVFSLFFLVFVGAWLFPIVGLIIAITSKGPVLFRQTRVGLNGEEFVCLKFRTMRNDPNASFQQATEDDPRVTAIGRFLRRTNLDEIPQFINVLTGDMSVVGPRPHVPELDAKFIPEVPGYTVRHTVKPGVTGFAQVLGCRGETRTVRHMKQRLRCDKLYVERESFAADLWAIGRTVWLMVFGDERAY